MIRRDDGGVTITAAFALTVLLFLVVAVVHVGSAVSARHRAQSAADLAALAAAGNLDYGVEVACSAGSTVAQAVEVSVVSCLVDGWDVVIEVSAPVMLGRFGLRDATAAARAGP